MIVLGLNFSHDGAAAIVKDGKLVTAISSERITRVKKQFGVTDEVIDYVLSEAGITLDEIDCIALTDYKEEYNHNTLRLYDPDDNEIDVTSYKMGINRFVMRGRIRGRIFDVHVLPHHVCHAASAYYTSNFDEAVCLSVDSSFGGIVDNSLIFKGEGTKLEIIDCPKLISGIGYAVFTECLGFIPAYAKAGTTMGLAAYGTPLPEVIMNINQYLQDMFYPMPIDEDPIQTELTYRQFWGNMWGKLSNKHPHELSFKEAADLAATIQLLLEMSITEVTKAIQHISPNLCLSGGSLLNCNTNYRIKKSTSFKNIHHFPACGDDGNAVGAALYVAHNLFDEPRYTYKSSEICYTGKKYDYFEPDYDKIAKMIADGKVIAWFMGASEYGPRALGNRSILADPRSYHTREKLNHVVKNREWFRPFAPVVLEEEAHNWFDFDGPSPYMLYTCPVLQPKEIPAATHVDGTARHQTINEEHNPPYYRLVKAFYDLTGVPVLINTSLNGNGEPILETEEDALKFLETARVDALVLNGRIIEA